MAPLSSSGQDKWNEVQNDFCHYMLPLASVSVSYDTIGIGIICHQWYHQWHLCIPYVKTIKMRYNMIFVHVMPLALASHDANGIINGTITFFRSRPQLLYSLFG